jgi:quercetin dioxygenase-like cupin family protein
MRYPSLWSAPRTLPLAVALLAGPSAGWAGPASDAVVERLISEQLPDVAGRELDMITVQYPPGGASAPHRHDAYALVYVLEGAVQMGIRGRNPVILRAGQTFLERPEDVHQVSRNASATQPAKFLVVFLKKAGQPLTVPVSPGP